ncbi:hypothetical protein [Rhizobium ecuadorense]
MTMALLQREHGLQTLQANFGIDIDVAAHGERSIGCEPLQQGAAAGFDR